MGHDLPSLPEIVCRNCGAQVPDTEPQYYFCHSECEREYDDTESFYVVDEPVEVIEKAVQEGTPAVTERVSPPNGDCQHGNCCEGFGYVLGYIQHLLGVLPQDSAESNILLRVMGEVGK